MLESPVESLIILLQETVKCLRSKNADTVEQIYYLETFCTTRLLPIYQRHQRADQDPFVICLVGLTNVGKSTLLEALLGVPVAPRKNGPATAVRVDYAYAHG